MFWRQGEKGCDGEWNGENWRFCSPEKLFTSGLSWRCVHVLYCPIKICILLNLLCVWASVHPKVILFFYIYFTVTHKHIKSDTAHMIYFGMIYFLLHRMKQCQCVFFWYNFTHTHTKKSKQHSRNQLKIDFQFVDIYMCIDW